LCKFNCFFKVPLFIFTTGYLDPSQFDQGVSSPQGIENCGNANKVKMTCQGFVVISLLLF
jgi:hypothetical protein